MKVRNLITELEKMPQDAEVLHLWDGEARTTIEIVYLAKNGTVITADFEEICYSSASRPLDAPTREEYRYWETPKENNYMCSSCENNPCTCED